ncbi:MAG: hypothetical protein OSA93_15470 [Akkermansiaceae bacterium]|jgi:hypothetical protein|nr:hypothetical protein [Akkermansiaceae bacterium]
MNHLSQLGAALEQAEVPRLRLIVAEMAGSFDVIALEENGDVAEAFPLPSALQEGIFSIAETEQLSPTWMHASFSMVVTPKQLPDDLQEGQSTHHFGEKLEVQLLGRSGLKYLAIFEAVHRQNESALNLLKDLQLSALELLKITQWLRTERILENRHGDRLTEVITSLGNLPPSKKSRFC